MQMLGLYHPVVLDGLDSDNAGSNLAHGVDVSVLAACVDLRLLVERNPAKLQRWGNPEGKAESNQVAERECGV